MEPQFEMPTSGALQRLPTRPLVFVAEDDADLRSLLVRELESEGCRVFAAASGLELLAAVYSAAGTSPPTLVISDQRMPGLDGLDAMEAMRRADIGIPSVLITAFGDDNVARRAERTGVIMLRKPFPLDILRAIVRRLVKSTTAASVACAACGSLDEPAPMNEDHDVFFCRECRALRDRYDPRDSSVDLGGEG